jgi:hypothetical protein
MRGKKTGGRQKGSLNKTTVEIRTVMQQFLSDETGQQKLLEQYQKGELNPSVLALFYHYAYGKPKDTLALERALPVMVVDELTDGDIERLRAERSE